MQDGAVITAALTGFEIVREIVGESLSRSRTTKTHEKSLLVDVCCTWLGWDDGGRRPCCCCEQLGHVPCLARLDEYHVARELFREPEQDVAQDDRRARSTNQPVPGARMTSARATIRSIMRDVGNLMGNTLWFPSKFPETNAKCWGPFGFPLGCRKLSYPQAKEGGATRSSCSTTTVLPPLSR